MPAEAHKYLDKRLLDGLIGKLLTSYNQGLNNPLPFPFLLYTTFYALLTGNCFYLKFFIIQNTVKFYFVIFLFIVRVRY